MRTRKTPCDHSHSEVEALKDQLSDAIGSLLDDALANGFELPMHVAILGRNGSFCAATYRAAGDELSAEIHASSSEAFVLPVNIMLTDSRGKATRMLISKDGEQVRVH